MRITKVYTKTGDDGNTALVGGQRVPKYDPRIDAYGTSDELMSFIGWARQELYMERDKFTCTDGYNEMDQVLEFIGNKLFTLGADLATRVDDRHPQMVVINEDDIKFLEEVCDYFNDELPPLTDFVLPGGSRTASALHVCRTIARRAERAVVELSTKENVGDYTAKYLNRISDSLFVMARWVNHRMDVDEVIWRRDLPQPKLQK